MSMFKTERVVTITVLAMIAAIGIVVRMFVKIAVVPGLVELTPGFMFSLLGGVVGGIPGGVLVGTIVGIGGALAGGEPPLLPMIGNICLGIGTGIAWYASKDRNTYRFWVAAIVGGAVIGGFIPSMTIFASFTESLTGAVAVALIDAAQACLWAIVALLVDRLIIKPIAGPYLHPDTYREEHREEERTESS
ncbi:MAG: hypothetical protein HXY34_03240 [Candidatus Thorarchaeota archaeon]|nr:hypothetical protein [Candidatus Thorarchaeota archaeon]